MHKILTPAELDALKKYDAPTISNAIESFKVRPQSEGFMSSQVRCMFPDMPPMAGYAVTAKIHADKPAGEGRAYLSRDEWWDYIETISLPRVLVIEDLDEPKGLGAFWGEVQAHIHKALGCVGCVTDGAVRDLPPVRGLGFHFFAGCVSVSHAYANLVEIGTPVTVGGLRVQPGDLLFGDMHGVVQIPLDIARDAAAAAEAIVKWEEPILKLCTSQEFNKKDLLNLVNRKK